MGRSPWAVKKTRTVAGRTKTTSKEMEERLTEEAAILKVTKMCDFNDDDKFWTSPWFLHSLTGLLQTAL